MAIRNIIFDVGNVLVRWDPHAVIKSVFPQQDPEAFYEAMRPVWLDLNAGKYSEAEGVKRYQAQFGMSLEKIRLLIHELKRKQTPIPGSVALLQKLSELGLHLYVITDNIKEIIDYHRVHSEFLNYFEGVVVSADIGILKPNPEIYRHLLRKYHLEAADCVFIDDLLVNVAGALSVGMYAFQFIDIKDCEEKLQELGINGLS